MITKNLVEDTKGGNLAYVSGVLDFDTLEEFAYIANEAHIAPAIFRDNKRNGDHFIATDFLCFDFDLGLQTAAFVHNHLVDRLINHALLASKNHLKDKSDGKGVIERFHAFLPVSEPICDRTLYKFAVNKLAHLFAWETDRACTDATRYFYRHRETLFLKENLKMLDVKWLQSMRELDEERKSKAKIAFTRRVVPENASSSIQTLQSMRELDEERKSKAKIAFTGRVVPENASSSIQTFQHTYAFDLLKNEMSSDGQRYVTSQKIIGVMLKCGLTSDEGLALFDEHASYGSSFTRQSVERMFRDFS